MTSSPDEDEILPVGGASNTRLVCVTKNLAPGESLPTSATRVPVSRAYSRHVQAGEVVPVRLLTRMCLPSAETYR